MSATNEELALLAAQGDRDALDTLVRQNLGLVRKAAFHFRERGTELEDLVQIGTIGLIKAVRNYNADFGTRFSTYAVPMIIGEIRKHLRDDGIIKLNRETKRNCTTVAIAREDHLKRFGREPTISELVKHCQLSQEEVIVACDASLPPLSLSSPVQGQDGEETPLESFLAGEDIFSPLQDVLSLRQALASLSEDERALIRLRYFQRLSQSETGKRLGLTQVTVSRKEKRILEKLRRFLTDT